MSSSSNDTGNAPRPGRKAPISVRESSAHLVAGRTKQSPPAPVRRFSLGDDEWVARLAGQGYGGTGDRSPGYFAAVRFFRADAPDRPVREALIPRGRFDSLYDDELREIFEMAEPIDIDDGV